MESSTLDLIASNRDSAKRYVESLKAEFAAIAKIGSVVVGFTSGGQGMWPIIRPAHGLTTAQRKRLADLGWKYCRWGLGDNWQCGQSNLGWSKP